MACCARLYKLYQVKKALDRMELAKINGERELMGLPPLQTWTEELWDETCFSIQTTCISKLCPWCEEMEEGHSYWERFRLFQEGSPQNNLLKAIIGYICSCLLSLSWFLIMVYQLEYSPETSAISCIVIGTILAFGLAYSKDIRCITLLILPGLCSSKGRTLLLAYAFLLVMAHPVANLRANVHVMADSLTCGQQLAVNATREVISAALAPINGFMGEIREILNTLVEFAEKLRESFRKVQDLYEDIADRLKKAHDWLYDMVNVCNAKLGTPYDNCIQGFNEGYQKCKDKLPKGLDNLCNIVTNTKDLCNMAKAGTLFCKATAAMKKYVVSTIKENINVVMGDIYDIFYFKVDLDYHYNVTLNQSKTFEEVNRDIQKEIDERLKPFKRISLVSAVFTVFLLWWVVFKAVFYRQRYLSIESYDNLYVNAYFERIDQRRKTLAKDTLLPLNDLECFNYIESTSFLMSSAEIKKLVFGLVFFLGTVLHGSFFMACDYGAYWLLHMIEIKGVLVYKEHIPSHLKLHVDGEGILADMYRALISKFDPVGKDQLVIDTTKCLPHPHEPHWTAYHTIGVIYGLSFILILVEAYLLRLRHIICGYYYPDRHKERTAWLYSHILRKRQGLLKTKRRQVKEKIVGQDQDGCLLRLAARFSSFAYCLQCCGVRYLTCVGCGAALKEDDPYLVRCASFNCKAVYCQSCFEELRNVCTACMRPIDYGDFSDVSEELDSSDEDVINE